jgi:hypothetical protein
MTSAPITLLLLLTSDSYSLIQAGWLFLFVASSIEQSQLQYQAWNCRKDLQTGSETDLLWVIAGKSAIAAGNP